MINGKQKCEKLKVKTHRFLLHDTQCANWVNIPLWCVKKVKISPLMGMEMVLELKHPLMLLFIQMYKVKQLYLSGSCYRKQTWQHGRHFCLIFISILLTFYCLLFAQLITMWCVSLLIELCVVLLFYFNWVYFLLTSRMTRKGIAFNKQAPSLMY